MLAAAMWLTGCTSADLRSQPPPNAEVRLVIVEPIIADKPEWQRLARRLRRQLIAELATKPQFAAVSKDIALLSPVEAAGGEIALIRGRIAALDAGLDLISVAFGDVGWGGAELTVAFQIRDRADRPAVEFTQTVSAAEPLAEATIIGTIFSPHFQPLYGDDLADALAAEVADAIAEWAAHPSR
jgi:hypothetical protein